MDISQIISPNQIQRGKWWIYWNKPFSLEQMPERGAIRRIGIYANAGYRQLFVKNYVIIYRVLKEKKEVDIVTVRYGPSNF